MKKLVLLIIGLVVPFLKSPGQIIAPDTVCPGTTVTFTTPASATAYTWSFTNVNVIPAVPGPYTPVASGGSLNIPSFTTLNNDNGSWYTFTSNYSANNIVRLSYGSAPTNVPVQTSLGTFGVTGSIYGGFDIVKDPVSGNWFGFGVNASQLLRLQFGASLANTPTANIYTFPSNFAWPHDLKVMKADNQWIGFVANRSGAITRLDFGTALTNTPLAVNLPVTNYSNPVSFSVLKRNGNWHMFIADLLGPAGISRLDFGTNLQNNTPTGTYLGNFSNQLSLVRSVRILADCDEIYGYAQNEYGMVYALNFGNNVTNNAPVISGLSNMGSNSFVTYMYNNLLMGLFETSNTSTLRSSVLRTYPTSTVTHYYNPAATYTFTTPGTYDVTLWTDQGSQTGTVPYCKQIVVAPTLNAILGPDTTLCNTSYTLNATTPGATGYVWNTGATTPAITATASGTYWVHVTGSPCTQGDTIVLTFGSIPLITATPSDTIICESSQVQLQANGATNYWWTPATGLNNPLIANPTAQPLVTTTYYVMGTNAGGCAATDSVVVAIIPSPDVQAMPSDTTICAGYNILLQASGAVSYTWSPATYLNNITSPNPIASPAQSIRYYVTGTNASGCKNVDSVNITVNPSPVVNITPVSPEICLGASVTLQATGGNSYSWSPPSELDNPMSAAPLAHPSVNMTYHVRVVDGNNCEGYDSVTVTVHPLPEVHIIADSNVVICGHRVRLRATGAHTYAWQPAALCDNPSDSDPWIDPKSQTYFYVTGTDIHGCTDVDSIKIDVIKSSVLFVPNAFSPNGDGKNDVFMPVAYCDMRLKFFAVYNRYGERIYSSSDQNPGWDGCYNSKKADMGTYFWYVEAIDESGKSFVKKGDVTLVR